VIEDWELPFHLGNALKYIARAGRKDPSKVREDISKAIWYLERYADQFIESEAQAQDADELLQSLDVPYDYSAEIHEAELEYYKSPRDDDIPASVIPGSDEDPPRRNYKKDISKFKEDEIFATYVEANKIWGVAKNGKKTLLNDGVGGANFYDEVKLFEEWDDDDGWESLDS